jgi:hypothetical protein
LPPRPTHEDLDVDPDDALRLAHNRYAEHLVVGWRALARPGDVFALHHRWKVLVDAPLAWLAAEGFYRPRRGEQIAALQEGLARMEADGRSWLEDVVVTLRQIREAQATGLVSRALLERIGWDEVPFAAGSRSEESARARAAEARAPLVRRTWPFHRALLQARAAGRRGGWEGLTRAVTAGPPGVEDREQGRRWLRRESWAGRLRESRRWHPLAPRPLRPWWRYGMGGTGPERVWLAAALRFASVPGWDACLRGMVRESHGLTPVPREPARAEAFLGQLWSGWMMGGERR